MRQFCVEESEGCMQDNILFTPMDLGQTGLVLELPEGFSQMEEEKQFRRYPWKGRPEFILENCSGVQVTAQDTGQKMETVQIRSAAEAVCRMTRELFPRYKLSPVYLGGESRYPVGWFRMEMPEIEIEHIKALSMAKEHMILLTFTYPDRESVKWRSIIRESFRTLKESGDKADG